MTKEKTLLVFDMDGTIADLYGQKGWLNNIESKNTLPYQEAQPLNELATIIQMLNILKGRDQIEIAIVTWGSKERDSHFLKETAKAKKEWLKKYNFPYDRFHCTHYGYKKRYPVSPNFKRNKDIPKCQILFDDSAEVREDWEKWENHTAVRPENMLHFLSKMVADLESAADKKKQIPFTGNPSNKELYLVLDCETATLPFVNEWKLTEAQKQKIAIAKPLIYDIAWRVIDKDNNIYSQHSYLIQETFFVPQVFNTAYYRDKRPLYMQEYSKGNILCVLWEQAMLRLEKDLEKVKYATAYNAMFDFKKAIPFTEQYNKHIYTIGYQEWEDLQRKSCKKLLTETPLKNPNFDPKHLELHGKLWPIADIWALACKVLLNTDQYKEFCIKNSLLSSSGLYFKSSAETAYKYLTGREDFIESHTALEDAEIESDILKQILEKEEITQGIIYFPFRDLGYTTNYAIEHWKEIGIDGLKNILQQILIALDEHQETSAFYTQLLNAGNVILKLLETHYNITF